MAYSTSNPPALLSQPIGGGGFQVWQYQSTDDAATVDTANYFTNGGALGLRVGGVVYVTDTDGGPAITTLHQVSATGDGTTDVNNLTTITQTDFGLIRFGSISSRQAGREARLHRIPHPR